MRSKVLACYRALHRTRQQVFSGDAEALELGKIKIREEFEKHKFEADPQKIIEYIKLAKDVEDVLRTMIVQAVKQKDNTYKVKITENTELGINPAYPPIKQPLPASDQEKKS